MMAENIISLFYGSNHFISQELALSVKEFQQEQLVACLLERTTSWSGGRANLETCV